MDNGLGFSEFPDVYSEQLGMRFPIFYQISRETFILRAMRRPRYDNRDNPVISPELYKVFDFLIHPF